MDENLFKKVPVKVQRKSGFDLSFQNLLTTKVGTITPVLCEELIPNETVHLKAAIQAQLPPLASDTFMRCDLKYEAFFVPHRLVMAGYQEWLVPRSEYGSSVITGATYQPKIPRLQLNISDMQPGTLADYLGVKSNIPTGLPSATTYGIGSASTIAVNALPFLAYHRVYDDWYRNTLIQNSIYHSKSFISSNSLTQTYSIANSQYVTRVLPPVILLIIPIIVRGNMLMMFLYRICVSVISVLTDLLPPLPVLRMVMPRDFP